MNKFDCRYKCQMSKKDLLSDYKNTKISYNRIKNVSFKL